MAQKFVRGLIPAGLDFALGGFQNPGGFQGEARQMGWGGRRAGAGRKPGAKTKRKVPLIPAQAHRQTVEEMPLDVLTKAMRDTSLPIELRLAAAAKAAPYYHARVASGPPKGSFEMTDLELKTAIAREKEHLLRAHPGHHEIRVVSGHDD
jgi:hypothetical protein